MPAPMVKNVCCGFILACFLAAGAGARDQLEIKEVGITGYSAYDFRQVVKGNWGLSAIDHYWSHEVFAGIGFRADISDRLSMISRVEGKMWNPYPNEAQRAWRQRNYSLWLDQACAKYAAIGDAKKPLFSITGGYFVYKYNPEVRNLGEFMFRSNTYPGLIFNEFDFAAARLLGFQFHLNLLDGMLKHDLIIQDESEMWPYGDISITNIVSVDLAKIVQIGGGVNLCRFFSVNDKYTTPPDSATNRVIDRVDTVTANRDSMIIFGDGFYTFKGTKIMGRASVDIKPLLGSPAFFGASDLKIYGEIGVIGLEDQGFYYTDISQRMPVMIGFNFPALGALDVVSIECEHYAYPFTPSNEYVITKAIPLPTDFPVTWRAGNWKLDDWKWSVYLKKTIMPGLTFTLQFARDHIRLPYSDGMPFFTESTIKPGDWSWVAKFTGSI